MTNKVQRWVAAHKDQPQESGEYRALFDSGKEATASYDAESGTWAHDLGRDKLCYWSKTFHE